MADDDELEAFRSEEDAAQDAAVRYVRDLLLFDFGGRRFGIDVKAVDSVVPWQRPRPIPRSSTAVHGVIQDQGRIIVVLSGPLGVAEEVGSDAARIVVCTTARGLIGVPATTTEHIGRCELNEEPAAGKVIDSERGALTYLDPAVLAQTALSER